MICPVCERDDDGDWAYCCWECWGAGAAEAYVSCNTSHMPYLEVIADPKVIQEARLLATLGRMP